MKHYYDSESFINKLLEETYRELPAKDSGKPSSQLLDYFNEKSILKTENRNLEDIFCSSSTKYYKLKFIEKTKCFRIEDLNLDFPSNWSLFKSLCVANQSKLTMLISIDEFDSSMLYQILSKFSEYDSKLYFSVSSDGVYLSYARVEDLNFEKTLNKFFSLENKTEEETENRDNEAISA